jgi:hypothetical protein
MAEGMDEVVIDGVAYVQLCYPSTLMLGDPASFLDQFDEKKRNEIRQRMIADLVEAGYFMRKDDYEKEHSIYKKDELFYGL